MFLCLKIIYDLSEEEVNDIIMITHKSYTA